MRIRVLAVVVLLAGCSSQVPTYSSSSGSLAISNDDALLYAVDSDSDSLFVLSSKDSSVVAQVKVGHQPEKVIVGSDDTIYVSNRMGRSVSIVHRGDWSVTSIATSVEPCGMAFTSDGKTLLVANATSMTDTNVGTLMGFDTTTLQRQFEVAVGPEPRGLAVSGTKAFVSLYKLGEIATVDLTTLAVSQGADVFARVNTAALSTRDDGSGGAGGPVDFGQPGIAPDVQPSAFSTVHPLGLETLTVTPDGRQIFAAAMLSSDQVLPSTPDATTATGPGGMQLPISGGGGGNSGYSGTSCGAGSVVAPALLTFDNQGASLAGDSQDCEAAQLSGQPPQVVSSSNPTIPIQGLSAAAVDPSGSFVYVVGRSSNSVAILPIDSAGADATAAGSAVGGNPDVGPVNSPPPGVGGFSGGNTVGTAINTISVGAGPSGVALSHDGKSAWVLNAFDHSVSCIQRESGILLVASEKKFTSDVLPADVVAGRKLFFSAVDSRMTSPTTAIACASCHLEGREDGHVWNFTDGPRQTPSLAGRMTAQTLPLHWNGEFNDMTSFMTQTVIHRMGGSVVTQPMEQLISAFIAAQPAADNPFKSGTLNAQQARGAAVFTQAGCAGCHTGEALTDNGFHDVGTFNEQTQPLLDNEQRTSFGPTGVPGFNTPSLLGVARTAPYLHDGSAATLRARVTQDEKGLHGTTSALSDGQIDDLLAFLQTL